MKSKDPTLLLFRNEIRKEDVSANDITFHLVSETVTSNFIPYLS